MRSSIPSFLLFVIILAASAPWWGLPLQRDQGVYAACGSTLVDGGAPYRDCWDTKGPLTHYTYALAELLFGVNFWGPYVLNALIAAATGLGLAAIARRWLFVRHWSAVLPWAIGLVYGLLLISIPFDHNAQSEGFANLFIALAVLLLTVGRERATAGWYAGGGALLAAVGGFKYTILAPAGLVGLALWMAAPAALRADRRRWLRLAGAAAAGAVAVWLLMGLYLWARGALALALEHLQFMFVYFPRVQVNPTLLLFPGESGPPLFYWQRTLREFLRLPVLYSLAFAGVGLALWRRRAYAVPLAVWLFSALAVVYPQKVFTLYHWTLALPAVVLAAGALVAETLKLQDPKGFGNLSGLLKRRVAVATAIALAVAANVAVRFYADQWLVAGPYLTGQLSRQELYESQAVWDEVEIANYVAERTAPDDLIWVWGNHTNIYYLSERRSPTRFIFNSPLMARIGPNPWQPRWQDEIVQALYDHPPTYLIVTWYDRTWFDYENPNQQFEAIPPYREFLDRYYQREAFLGRFAIHRLIPWWSRESAPELLDAVTLVDLLDVLPGAVQQPAPNDGIDIFEFAMPGDVPYPVLFLHPEGRVTYDVTLPGADGGALCFRADLALDPQSWGWGGDGATFRVEVNGEVVFEQYVSNDEADRRWRPVLFDLSGYAGRQVQLTLATGPGPNIDFTGDRAGWGLPRIVRAPGATCDENTVVR